MKSKTNYTPMEELHTGTPMEINTTGRHVAVSYVQWTIKSKCVLCESKLSVVKWAKSEPRATRKANEAAFEKGWKAVAGGWLCPKCFSRAHPHIHKPKS